MEGAGMPKIMDITGLRSGRLVAVRFSHLKNHRTFWVCLCDCGKELLVASGGIRGGWQKSCGCSRRKPLTHGHTSTKERTPTYQSWKGMLNRCRTPSHNRYDLYGGRGITVCERWLSFENFLADMGERPEGKTLDRIDSDGNYGPWNCRWATSLEQRHNRRDYIAAHG
jgi:hypothetical protein